MKFRPDFLVIPYDIIVNPELTPLDRVVYGVCYWFERMKDGVCWASNDSIAEILTVNAGSITNSLSRLEKEGFIERVMESNSREAIVCQVYMQLKRPSFNGAPPHHSMGTAPSTDGHIKNIDTDNNKNARDESRDNLEVVPDEEFRTLGENRRIEAKEHGYKGDLIKPLVSWAEERIGRKLMPPIKQKKAIHSMLYYGFTPEKIKECWLRLENDDYWSDKGIDFMTVLNDIGKARKTKKVSQVVSKSANW